MSKKSSKKRMKLKFKKDSLLGKLIIVFILLVVVLNILRYAAYFKKDDNSQLSVIIQNEVNVEMKHDVYIDENKIVYFSEDDMRELFDKELYYEKDEDNLRRYISISQSKILEITEDKNHMYINGSFTKIKGKVICRDGVYYFPISELADVYNLEVDYLPDTNKLNIEKLSEEKVTAIVNRDTELKYKMTGISKNVEKLSQGETVTVMDASDKKWIKVKTKDYQVGYVKKSKLLDFTKARNDLELANEEFSDFDLKNDIVIEINDTAYENFDERISSYENRTELAKKLTSKVSKEISTNPDVASKKIGLKIDMTSVSNIENYYRFLKELKAYVNANGCFLIIVNNSNLDSNIVNDIANVVV